MDLFQNAKVVRLQSTLGKYLNARRNGGVNQRSDPSSPNVLWTVEQVCSLEGGQAIRLKSCYGDYLTRNHEPVMLLETLETEVVQTPPYYNHPKVNWTPVRPRGWDWSQVMLVTKLGGLKALRGGGRWPPHDQLVTVDVFNMSGMVKNLSLFVWEVHVVSSYQATAIPRNLYSPLSHENFPVQVPVSQQQQSQQGSPTSDANNPNYVVVQYNNNYTLAAPNTSVSNSGQNANGSGTQTNGDVKQKPYPWRPRSLYW